MKPLSWNRDAIFSATVKLSYSVWNICSRASSIVAALTFSGVNLTALT